MIHTKFAKTYLINVAGNKPVDVDRRTMSAFQCGKLGLQYEIFPGIDNETDPDPLPVDEENVNMEGWTKGAFALAKTTLEIIKHAKAQGYPSVLILEDDLVFHPNATARAFQAIESLPNDWELLHFSNHHIVVPEWVGRGLMRLTSSWSCQMYAVNSRVYDLYISELEKLNRPIDWITAKVIQPRGKSYGVEPSIINTLPNHSRVRGKFHNHLCQ